MKVQDLASAVERLEDLMRRYCSRCKPDGVLATLDDDIKMSSLEALLPDPLGSGEPRASVHLNRGRLDAYAKLREEAMLYTEAKGGGQSKGIPQVSAMPMNVDSMQ